MSEIVRPAIDALDDESKLRLIIELAHNMSEEYKNKVIAAIAAENVTGETQVTVSSNEQLVCINFGRPLAWFAIPKAHALQLGVSLMEHAGARLEQIERPKPDAS